MSLLGSSQLFVGEPGHLVQRPILRRSLRCLLSQPVCLLIEVLAIMHEARDPVVPVLEIEMMLLLLDHASMILG